ncbi:peptidase M19 [Rasiella rasia]|uniref:Peptidase M19 n=1 Tax=Rasiella rasia TaxID=2744027 RepID=A0A6G6GIJ4_9FLAO|nr:membrane dipeptidase [Rasiella rasia]QIE58369.1 peptidase M19 [Rasiella rasia]
MKTHYVDIHCHPSLKGFSKSFKYTPPKQNALDANRKNSIWHYSPPTVFEKFLNRMITLTKFTQTDMTALARSRAKVVIVSLYPFEKHFLSKRVLGWKGLTDVLVNLAASISQSRIDYVLRHQDYFEDLESEYQFYEQLHNQVHKIDNVFYTYRLVNNFAEIEHNFTQETPTKKIINIVLSIEGGHSFNSGLEMNTDTADAAEVLDNLKKVKNWKHKPAFITFAHHFYNELCGHARSISIGALRDNQNRGLNSGITDLGIEVIDRLLKNTNGPCIPIDIKHMSTTSRKAYYDLLDTKYKNEKIPVIASHGAANGHRSIVQWDVSDYPERAEYFNNIDINFYDDELLRIAKTNGMFGIQLDERRIGSKKAISQSKIYFPNKRKQLQKKSLLVWRQVEHVAEVLNKEGLFCWGIQTIGSDFDGIVNPIKGLWTAENIKDLGEEMLHHAKAYLDTNRNSLQDFNKISAESIVERVLHGNAMDYLKRNFN